MVRRPENRHAVQGWRGRIHPRRYQAFRRRVRSATLSSRRSCSRENDLQRSGRLGWHTAATAMRLLVALRPFGPHPVLGLAVDELRWLAPVRPGDVLRIEGEVVELTPSRTKPQGAVRVKWTAFNQNDEPVLTFTPTA